MLASLRFRLWLTYMLVVGVVITIAAAGIFIYVIRNPAIDRRELQRRRLAIAREIFQVHGGSIQVANRGAGESGCVFTVRLPLSRLDDEPPARRRSDVAALPAKMD